MRRATRIYTGRLRRSDGSRVNDRWRLLIDDAPVDGALNMALDRAVQISVRAGEVPPTLRLYRWLRPTVTLGRFQDTAGVDLAECSRRGIDVVRRFTGGRGVLHDDEVTYALVVRLSDGVPRGTAASYRWLSGALVAAFVSLGVDASLVSRPGGRVGSVSACYLHATQADLALGATKLSGSAQVWSGDTVLQHGSLTLSRDVAREAAVFGLSSGEARRLAEETSTLNRTLGRIVSAEEVEAAVVGGVQQALGVTLTRGDYTLRERDGAVSLRAQTSAERVPARSDVTGSG
jgi:lipoyl(octanoyl) transferase